MSTTDKTYQQDVTKLITNYSQSEEHLVAFSLSLSLSLQAHCCLTLPI